MTNTPMGLGDMIVPDMWHQYIVEESTQLSAFFQSGVITDMNALLIDQMGGTTVNMPFFSDLAGADEVVDDTITLTVNKTGTGKDVATVLYRAKVYGGSDLAGDLSGADPVPVIISRFGDFWKRAMQTTLLATVNGAMSAAGVSANTWDISGGTGSAGGFSGAAFIDAKFRLGDHASSLSAVAVHSATYATMLKQNLIDFIKASDNGEMIPVYMGHRIIVDDGMPVANGVYTTYLFGAGAVGYAERMPKNPVEPWRDPLTMGGYDYIVNRRSYVMHIRGIKWVGTSVLATPSNAELNTAANWTAVYDPKLIPIVTFKHTLN